VVIGEDESKDIVNPNQSEELSELFEIRNHAVLSRETEDAPIVQAESNSRQIEEDVAKASSDDRRDFQAWRFQSAYQAIYGDEPKCTNWSGDFFGTLDYIFLCDQWKVLRADCFPLLQDSSQPDTGMTAGDTRQSQSSDEKYSVFVKGSQPSSLWPSDHFMLVSVLEII
jgi:mRNA deadenylase 3'-5' endonuclease subunit Ccr4